jgi:hypothetical protein
MFFRSAAHHVGDSCALVPSGTARTAPWGVLSRKLAVSFWRKTRARPHICRFRAAHEHHACCLACTCRVCPKGHDRPDDDAQAYAAINGDFARNDLSRRLKNLYHRVSDIAYACNDHNKRSSHDQITRIFLAVAPARATVR